MEIKKREILVLSICLLVVGLLCTLTVGRDFKLLTSKEVEKLKPEAKEHYEKALKDIDRIRYSASIEKLKRAHKVDPDHIPLAFLLAEMSIQRGIVYGGQKAADYYKVAEETLDSVLKQKKLKRAERKKANDLLKEVLNETDIMKRDSKRALAGERFRELYLKEQETPTPTPTPGAGTGKIMVTSGR